MRNIFLERTIIALLTFTLISVISCYGKGKNHLIYIDELHLEIEKIDNGTDSVTVINDSIEIRMVGIFANDSIYIFECFPESPSFLYTLKKTEDSITLFVIREKRVYDTFVYRFNKSEKTVTVNDNIYYLNEQYYNYLEKEGVQQMNVLPLISLFTRDIEYFYSLSPLIDNVWIPIKLAKGSRILRAEIYTESPHSDMLYGWNISYTYNNSDEITSIRKNYKEGGYLHFDLKLISKSKGNYCYDIFLVDDGDRYSEDIKRHINKSTLLESTYVERQQNGCTLKYANKTLRRRKLSIDGFFLNSDYLQDYIDRKINKKQ